MRKILISDYDGTIYQDDRTTKENITAINRFRETNVFAVATGRSYEDFSKAIETYGIKCDYYLLNYGAQVLNEKEKIIYETPLSNIEIEEIYNFFKDKECKIYYCNEKENSLAKTNKTYKIILVYEDKKIQMEDYYEFIKKYKYNTFILNNHSNIEIISPNTNKSKAIDFISNTEKIADIKVIGDGNSDISMIKKYHGYCVESAIEEVKKVSTKTYRKVADFINQLLEDENK
ncbi:MAG: HAD hydrolase family protein [Bacilli bacterium]|nr:HAD hydrolase family protein [Bacilli bacterium]